MGRERDGGQLEDMAEEVERLAERLAELSFERLLAASELSRGLCRPNSASRAGHVGRSGRAGGSGGTDEAVEGVEGVEAGDAVDAGEAESSEVALLVAEERRLNRARRALEKAAALLRSPVAPSGSEAS